MSDFSLPTTLLMMMSDDELSLISGKTTSGCDELLDAFDSDDDSSQISGLTISGGKELLDVFDSDDANSGGEELLDAFDTDEDGDTVASTKSSAIECHETMVKGKSQVRDAAWNTKLQELKSFKAVTGHCNVPQKYGKHPELGRWVFNQRRLLRGQYGDPNDPQMIERKKLLIGIDLAPSIGKGQAAKVNGHFQTDNHDKAWEAKFAELQAFHVTNGHCDVRRKENDSLGRWVAKQREKHAEFAGGKKSGSLTLEGRFERLRQIGFRFAL